MKINLITSVGTGNGLDRDLPVFKRVADERGDELRVVQFNEPTGIEDAELNIFDEVLAPRLFSFAPRNWWIIHPELVPSGWLKLIHNIDMILARTRAAYDISNAQFLCTRVEFISSEATDLLDLSVPRKRKFLHVAGNSWMKNTEAIVRAWQLGSTPAVPRPGSWRRITPDEFMLPELTIISRHRFENIPNIKWVGRLSAEEHRNLVNESMFNILPSAFEGFGHSLYEASSTGAVVITADGPSTKDAGEESLLIKSRETHRQGLAPMQSVYPEDVLDSVRRATLLSDEEIVAVSKRARQRFINSRNFFRSKFNELLNEAGQ